MPVVKQEQGKPMQEDIKTLRADLVDLYNFVGEGLRHEVDALALAFGVSIQRADVPAVSEADDIVQELSMWVRDIRHNVVRETENLYGLIVIARRLGNTGVNDGVGGS